MSALVIDASVAVKWVVSETNSDRAASLLALPQDLIAPDVVLVEAGGALSRRVRQGQTSPTEGAAALLDLQRYFTELIASEHLLKDAFALSLALQHPLADCMYLALSRQRDAPLVTADLAFLAKLAGTADQARAVNLATWV